MSGTFAYNGVIYDADSGLEVGRVPSARLGVNAWVASEPAQAECRVSPITFTVEAPHVAASIVDPAGEDEPPIGEPLSGMQRLAHYEMVRAHWRLVGSMSLDPSESSDAEPEGIVYETTPDTALARIDGFVWLRLDAQGAVEFASLECQARPVCKLRIGFRRTFAADATLVETSPQDGRAKVTEAVLDKNGDVIMVPHRYWKNVKDGLDRQLWEKVSPEVEPGLVEDEDLLMAWIHRDDIEVNRARRTRLEETADTSREWIKGAAAPKDLAEFDYERLLSNPDVPVKAQRHGRKLLPFLVQERAFPGEQNLGLVLEQRLAAGDEVVSERMLAAWAESMRHRFNVRRYVEAIATAFGDDPRDVFQVIEDGRRAKSASWAKVEAFVAGQYAAFAEDSYLSGVSDGCCGEWLATGDEDQSEEWRQIISEGGFGTEYADIGHSLYQTRLVSTRRPSIGGHKRTPYIASMPIRVRPTRASERGVFTSEELVKGLLATVRRMEPLKDYETVSDHRTLPEPLWKTPVFGVAPREARGKRFWNQMEAYCPPSNKNSRAQVRARLVATHA